MKRLAIITTHPIQYFAPWFGHLARGAELSPRVFYLWDFGVTEQEDAGFKQTVKWDVPLLEGYDYEFVPNTSRAPGTHHFWGLQNPTLLRQVACFNPDVVLMIGYNYASLQSFIQRWRRAPLLFRGDSHRLVARRGWKEYARRRLLSLMFRRFAAFLYVGKANRDYFRYHRVPEHKLHFAPHAVDNERFFTQCEAAQRQARVWKQELGIPADHQVVLFAGKFEAEKRPTDLLLAFTKANLSGASLLFVGAGPLEGELRRRAAGNPHVYFAPFQNQTLMPRTYAAADLVVLPSASETWGLAINEAMCMGRPVVVSEHVGCAQDLVRDGRNGFVFPVGDVAALAAKLTETLSERGRLQRWGEESRRLVSEYSYARATEGLRSALGAVGV